MKLNRRQLQVGVTGAYAAAIATAIFVPQIALAPVLIVGAILAITAWGMIAEGERRDDMPNVSVTDEPGRDVSAPDRMATPPPF